MTLTQETYNIVGNMGLLEEFVEWLPDLEPHEKFYCCLFARKKYAAEVPWIKSDKCQMKRFMSDKERLIMKIKQLECPIGWYRQHSKDGIVTIPQAALAVYISPNPRNMWKATFEGIKRFAQLIETNGLNPNSKQECANIHQEAMSCIQRSCSRKVRIPFDLDNLDVDILQKCVDAVEEKCDILRTRGGYHVFVYADEVKNKTWYKTVAVHCDVKGDNLMPVPGCYQGGFIPHFILMKGQ